MKNVDVLDDQTETCSYILEKVLSSGIFACRKSTYGPSMVSKGVSLSKLVMLAHSLLDQEALVIVSQRKLKSSSA